MIVAVVVVVVVWWWRRRRRTGVNLGVGVYFWKWANLIV
jgi:hypothetical protein